MAIKITVKPPEVKKIGNIVITKPSVQGGVKIDKSAKKLLEKQQERLDLRERPVAAAKPPLSPSSTSPETSVLAALWAHPARVAAGRTLTIVRHSDGRRYFVEKYVPHTRTLVLSYPDKPYGYFQFEAEMTQATEEKYMPVWG